MRKNKERNCIPFLSPECKNVDIKKNGEESCKSNISFFIPPINFLHR